MLAVDYREQMTNLRPETEIIGTVSDVIDGLHLEAHGMGIGRVVTQILHALRDQELFVQSSFYDGPQLYLTGSDAKRIYGGTPDQWYMPSAYWRGVVVMDSIVHPYNDPIVSGLINGGKWDTDIRFVLKSGATMRDVYQVMKHELTNPDCIMITEMKHHGVSSQLRVLLGSKYHLDLGALPDYRRHDSTWSSQIRDDARLSPMLPWRVFAASCPIMNDDHIYINKKDREAFWYSPYSSGTALYRSSLEGALIAWLRSKITDAFWPPHFQAKSSRSYYEVFTEDTFWPEVTSNSKGREQRLTDRANEITSNTLLLLTLDPKAGAAMKSDGILDHLGLGKVWDGDGTFDPLGLAHYLRVSEKELITLCHPVI